MKIVSEKRINRDLYQWYLDNGDNVLLTNEELEKLVTGELSEVVTTLNQDVLFIHYDLKKLMSNTHTINNEYSVHYLERIVDNRKELSAHMQFYMKYDSHKNQDEIENEFKSLIEKFVDEHGLDYQIYDIKIQED